MDRRQTGQPASIVDMRLLVPIRVSRDTDESRSPENQRLGALEYQDEHPGVTIIFTDVPDLDVSGATPIEEREGIAPWLTPERFHLWDGMGGYEMDRISRDLYNYIGFVRKMTDRGKIIVDLTDGTDTSTLKGRQTLEDRIMAAQRYREFVSVKRAQASKRASDAGEYDGRRPGFGYMPEQFTVTDTNGKIRKKWRLVKDPAKVPYALRLIDMAFAGESYSEMARQMQADGLATTLGYQFSYKTVQYILRSPTLMGYVTKMEGPRNKQVVTIRRDRDGKPIKFTDKPIIREERWHELQLALDRLSYSRGGNLQSSHVLRNVAFCRKCSQPCEDPLPCPTHDVAHRGYRRAKYTSKGNFYYCTQCGEAIELELFEAYVDSRILREAGNNPLYAPKLIPGTIDSGEINRLQRKIERLRQELDLDPEDEDLARSLARNEAKIYELEHGPQQPDRVLLMPVEPATTVAEHWHSLETGAAKNRYLVNTGCIFYADSEGVTGQLGWMALDAPSHDYSEFRAVLRALKLPAVRTWRDIALELGYVPRRRSKLEQLLKTDDAA